MSTVFIYSTSTGGPAVQKNTERMKNLVKAATKKDATVVFLDIEQTKRAEVWALSGKKGVYPLLFLDDNFVGDMNQVEELNEMGELAAKVGGGGGGGALTPSF